MDGKKDFYRSESSRIVAKKRPGDKVREYLRDGKALKAKTYFKEFSEIRCCEK